MTLTRRNCGRGHSYRLDDEKAPGVTSIIGMRRAKGFENHAAKVTANYAVDHWSELDTMLVSERLDVLLGARSAALNSAALRGTRLHRYAERLHHDEEISGGELDDEQSALVDSYLQFLDRTALHVVAAELVVGSRDPRFCGTADLVADLPALTWGAEAIPASRWLLDVKTGRAIWPDSALQTCAYSRAQVYVRAGVELPLADLGIQRCGVVHVRTDGWDLIPLDTGDETWETFLHLLWLYDHAEAYDTWVGEAVDPPPVPLLSSAAQF